MRKLFIAARLPSEDVRLLDELAAMGAAKDRSDALRKIIAGYKLATAIASITAEPGLPPTCPKCGGRLVAVVGTDELVDRRELQCSRCGARYRLEVKGSEK